MDWRCSWKNNNTILWRNTSKFMEVLAESSLIIKIKNKNVLKWLTYYVHRKLLRGRGSSKYYHGYIEGGWGYKGPKNVLRSMWLIPNCYVHVQPWHDIHSNIVKKIVKLLALALTNFVLAMLCWSLICQT